MKPLVLCIALLPGCSYFAPVVKKGADGYDDVRAAAEFTMCKAISVGAWIRAYGSSKEKAEAWRTLCHEPAAELPSQ
jgi:hypothetical protein